MDTVTLHLKIFSNSHTHFC